MKKKDLLVIFDHQLAFRSYNETNILKNLENQFMTKILIIGSNLFVHGGILPQIAKKYSVTNLNQLMSLYLFDKLDKHEFKDFIKSNVSPLWTRKFGNIGVEKHTKNNNQIEKDECDNLLNPLKEIYQVYKIFVGHTPILEEGVSSVCNGKIWLTDYGLSKAFDKFDKNLVVSSSGKITFNCSIK
jgi:hypothetical protein